MMKKIILILQFSLVTATLAFVASCANAPKDRWDPKTQTVATAAPVSMTEAPRKIALLLPLSGPLAPYANAVRNGFFTTYYQEKNQFPHPPTITVYDTAGKNSLAVYQMAVAQGADFVVGPLDKPAVAALANDHSLTVPVLALNTNPGGAANNNKLVEFALSPTDEAQLAAVKATQDHHHNVIILASGNAWGQRLANAFATKWKSLGGTVVATQYYGSIPTLAKNMREVLRIEAADKEDHQLQGMLHEKIRSVPERRHDFDSIFLVATPAMAKQIQPLLRFYFAGDVPIYTTSQIYSPSAERDTDLDGILFCDMPWVLSPGQMQPPYLNSIQRNIQTLWPNSYESLSKFYAMGVDAFDLMNHFKQMQQQPSYGLKGATGTLYLTPQHEIDRQLLWAKIENGHPRVIG